MYKILSSKNQNLLNLTQTYSRVPDWSPSRRAPPPIMIGGGGGLMVTQGQYLQYNGHFQQGRIQDLKKGGGGHNTPVFFGPPPASKVAQVPKKLMSRGGGGGGGLRHFFFRSATSVESRASPKRGPGESDTFYVFFLFVFLGFKRGGGGKCRKRFEKGGHGPGVPPP